MKELEQVRAINYQITKEDLVENIKSLFDDFRAHVATGNELYLVSGAKLMFFILRGCCEFEHIALPKRDMFENMVKSEKLPPISQSLSALENSLHYMATAFEDLEWIIFNYMDVEAFKLSFEFMLRMASGANSSRNMSERRSNASAISNVSLMRALDQGFEKVEDWVIRMDRKISGPKMFPPGGIMSKNDTGGEYIVPVDKAARMRTIRNRMLRESDYTQLADVMSSMSRDEQAAWRLYRQELRDLPSLPNWPLVDFPTPPNYKGE